MKVVILGSTGYLGQKLTKKLISQDHEVLCLKLKKEDFFEVYGGSSSNSNGFSFNTKPLFHNIEELDKLSSEYDCLINLCCRYQRPGIKDIDIFDSNLLTPLSVLTKFIELGIKKHVSIDTSLPKYLNTYSLAKKEYADIVRWLSSKYKIDCINVLLENFYGPDEPKDRFIPSTIIKMKNNEDIMLTAGDQKRDWIYVDDVIDGLVKIIEIKDLKGYLDFPLGSGENIEVRKVIEYLKEIIQSDSNLLFGSIEKRNNEPETLADTSLMNKYGIKIKYHWQEGFKKMVDEI